MAVIRVTAEGLVLEEVAPDFAIEDVQKATAARLLICKPVKEMR
jgi:acetate CoA/acetoacetate CoA-transferase beta subunit